MTDLTLSSPAFDDGERIPEKHGHDAADVSPPLTIAGVPDDAESLALVMDDPDAVEPAGKVWDHWVVWNVPPDAELPEGWDPEADGASEGTNDFGERGYGGPAPPDREHTYRFRLFALDTTLDLPASADKEDLKVAMSGHVIAEAKLEGTYAP
jgi:Raf kinase inhibitor-like YbhB/YbcL family protein